MKHILSAAVALAFGLGVAVSAQAQNANTNAAPAAPQAATQQPRTAGAAQMHRSRVNYPKSHTAMVKEAQSRLKLAGFYKGKIDGKMGPMTKQALAQFERQHGLPVTHQLNRRTFAALVTMPGAGVGSSMPHQAAPARANGMTGPMANPMPTQTPGAGGSTGATATGGAANGTGTGH